MDKNKPLPCKELKCELLRRLSDGVTPSEFTLNEAQMSKQADGVIQWFSDRVIKPYDALGILEKVKAGIWEYVVKTN